MDRTEVKQIARFLLDCEHALCEQDDTASMMLYLGRLDQVIQRIMDARPSRADRDVRFGLAMAMRKAGVSGGGSRNGWR